MWIHLTITRNPSLIGKHLMAKRMVTIPLSEVKQIFSLLVEYQQFFHQPLHYDEQKDVMRFLRKGAYNRLHKAVYTTVQNWLPPDVLKEIRGE